MDDGDSDDSMSGDITVSDESSEYQPSCHSESDDKELEPSGNRFLSHKLQLPTLEQSEISNNDIRGQLDGNADVVDETGNEASAKETTEKSRKRKRQPSTWKRNIKKEAYQKGKSYINSSGKEVKEKQMGPGCGVAARCRCKEKVSLEQRQGLFQKFYSIETTEKKRDYLNKLITKVQRKRICNKSGDETSRRSCTLQYSFIIGNDVVRVCKTMFLHTFSITDQWVKTILQKTSPEGVLSDSIRGKHKNHHRTSDDMMQGVRDHIDSFERVESHYIRKDSARQYLDSTLNVRKMYRMYSEKCQEEGKEFVSPWVYEKVFNEEYNLGFFKPKKDMCDVCETYKNADPERKASLNDSMQKHLRNKDMARAEKEADKLKAKDDSTFLSACFDLQQVLNTPHCEVSLLYYKRKLSTYNLTIYNMGIKKGACFMWHEGIGRRGSIEISSCVYRFLKQECLNGYQHFSFFSDNCAGQNRNRFVFFMYLFCVSTLPIDSICHKFLEKGHTQNEGDSMHSVIERAKKGMKIYIPQQWYTLAATAKQHGKRYEVFEMCQDDFFDFKEASAIVKNWTTTESGERIKWSDIRVMLVNKDKPWIMSFKYEYDEEYKTIDLLHKFRGRKPRMERVVATLPHAYSSALPISEAKYSDLILLCQKNVIPPTYHDFYQNLKHSEAHIEEDE